MRLPISLSLPALWAASYVVGKGPSGLKPLPITCDSCCPPGVSCPANDGCFIQGRANMSAEAGERCSTSVESVIAAEQTSCAASISAQQTSCAASISAQRTSCAARNSAEQTSCISAQQSSCAASISAQQTSCAASVYAEQTSCAASISAQQTSCAASIQTAAASAAAGQKCAVSGWGQGWYQVLNGVDLAGCKARCLADSRCLSYSDDMWGPGGNCYLYEKVAMDVPTTNYPRWGMYDRNCPGQKCAVSGWGQGWYQVLSGIDLAGCKARCLADSRCLSYSDDMWGPGGNCYLYEKVAMDVPTTNYPRWGMYDRNCP